jgi:hypothetical protein
MNKMNKIYQERKIAMEYTLDTEIEFYAGLGFVRGNREEIVTLRGLGLDEEDFEEMSESDIEEFLNEQFEIWLSNYLDSGWNIKG